MHPHTIIHTHVNVHTRIRIVSQEKIFSYINVAQHISVRTYVHMYIHNVYRDVNNIQYVSAIYVHIRTVCVQYI